MSIITVVLTMKKTNLNFGFGSLILGLVIVVETLSAFARRYSLEGSRGKGPERGRGRRREKG